jgi:hypothetical protein
LSTYDECTSSSSSLSSSGTICTFIYSSSSGSDGTCVEKGTGSYDCDDINRQEQCNNGGGITSLDGKCKWDGTKCVVKV